MPIQLSECVLLRDKGDIIGSAKCVMTPCKSRLADKLHGYELRQFARREQKLVAVHMVQIFVEFEDRPYPYTFKSFEDLPTTLGDLNDAGKAFKNVIAWNMNKLILHPEPCSVILGMVPRVVSAKCVSPLRAFLRRSPMKIRLGPSSSHDVLRAPSTCQPKQKEPRLPLSVQIDIGEEDPIASRFLQPRGVAARSLFAEGEDKGSDEDGEDDDDEDLNEILEHFDESCDQFEMEEQLQRKRGQIKSNAVFLGESELLRSAGGSTSTRESHERVKRRRIDDNRNASGQGSPARNTDRWNPQHVLTLLRGTGGSYEVGESQVNTGQNVDVMYRVPFDVVDLNRPKRRYTFKTRKPAVGRSFPSLRRQQRREKLFSTNIFESLKDYCSFRCFEAVDKQYAWAQAKKIEDMSRPQRKRALIDMLNRDKGCFEFDGRRVCSRFVSAGFGLSSCLQSCVKGTPKAPASCSVLPCPRLSLRVTEKDEVINFLKYYAKVTGDNMPHKREVHLPSMNKKQAFELYEKQMIKIQSSQKVSLNTFYKVWGAECKNIKTYRNHGFTKCGECERFRELKQKYFGDEEKHSVVREYREKHRDFVAEERRGYFSRQDLAIRYPGEYYSLVVDGADQKSEGLPHFKIPTKDDRGHKLKVKCVGLLEHGQHKNLTLFTMTEEFETGANHIVEAIHRVIQLKKERSLKLPKVLFVQADNCIRENKNRYFIGYFELLVACGVFLKVQVSFLPIGHTHSDIDQCFSAVSSRLGVVNAFTLDSLIHELRLCYTPRANAENITKIVNFSGLCEKSKCLMKVDKFSHFRYFRFTRSVECYEDCPFHTSCDVKCQLKDVWEPLDPRKRRGFLKFIPDLNNTPPVETNPPDNVLKVDKCLRAEEGRMNDTRSLERLEQLRNKVYTARKDSFHWDLESAFELNGDYRSV